MADKQMVKIEEDIKDAISALEALLAPALVRGRGTIIADLYYRARQPASIDGFGRGGGGERVAGGGSGDPTGEMGVARAGDNHTSDPVRQAVKEMLSALGVATRAIRTVDVTRERILGEARRAMERASTVQVCPVKECGRTVTGIGDDRIKRGYCPRCYLRWCAWKAKNTPSPDPTTDRQRFEAELNAAFIRRREEERIEALRMAGSGRT